MAVEEFEIDEALLAEAARELGTSDPTDTVNAALDAAIARARARRAPVSDVHGVIGGP